jgi:hypothetical protein
VTDIPITTSETMMKVRLLAICLLTAFSTSLFAQDDPIPPRRTKAAKVGFFGGVTPGWLFVDVEPVNQYIAAAHGAPLKDSGIFMFGGGGAAYIGIINNVRIGGVGMGGTISSSAVDAAGIRRDVDFSVGFGGVTIEYVFPVVPRLDVAAGGMLGWGGVDITLRQDTGQNLTWANEWNNFGSGNYGNPVNNITRELSGSYFVWVPSVNIEYALLGWLGIRIGASYVGMSAGSWSADGEYDLIGVPSDINGQGFMINGGIFIGTF